MRAASMRLQSAALALLLLSGCASHLRGRDAWQRLNTSNGCQTFETVTVEELYYVAGPEIRGVVQWEHGQGPPDRIPNVQVTIRPLGGEAALHATTTDSNGEFTLPPLPGGWYQLDTCRSGWNSIVVPVQVRKTGPAQRVVLYVSLAN